MSLAELLEAKHAEAKQNIPADLYAKMAAATAELADSGIVSAAPKPGEKLAEFALPNHKGETQNLSDLLAKGPLVVTFYRGGWCPYCNLELLAYQKANADIKAAGATLIAITPELPDSSLSTTEKNELEFEVLSDVNSEYGKSLGIGFTLPAELQPIYANFGIHLEEHNGKGQFDLPLAATFLVKQDGTIASAFVDVDYTKRKDPEEIISELKNL